jgi:FKBP-type peptidyl-prolyl cis-trans isomerase
MIRKNKRTILLFVTGLVLVTLFSCDPGKKFREMEEDTIQTYLSLNPDKNFVLKPSGLYYLEVQTGTGVMPVTNDTAYVKYTGKFLDGTVFDANMTNGATDTLIFPVNHGWLILGVDEGINYMRVGGTATLLMPSSLGFGAAGSYPAIPGYSPLLFEVQLLKVKSHIAK